MHGRLAARILSEAREHLSENLIHHGHAQQLASEWGEKNSPLGQFARTGEITSEVTRDLEDALRLTGKGGPNRADLERLQAYLQHRVARGEVHAVDGWNALARAGMYRDRMGQMGDYAGMGGEYVGDAGAGVDGGEVGGGDGMGESVHVASGAAKEINTASVGNTDLDGGYEAPRNQAYRPARPVSVPGILQMRSKDRPAQEIKDRGKARQGDVQRARAAIVRRPVAENADRVDKKPLSLAWNRESRPGRPEHHKLGQVLRVYNFREQITPTGWPTFHHDHIGEVVLNPDSGGWGSTTGAHGRDERDLRAWLASIGVQRV